MRTLALFLLLAVFVAVGATDSALAAKTHTLPATANTTFTGFFDNSLPPVLKIDSGDIVETQSLTLYSDRIKPTTTMAEIVKMRSDLAAEKKTGHTLTGPIYVNGAEPGDVLEIKILKLVPRPYGVNYFMPGSFKLGTIPEDYPDGYLRILSLDLKKMTTQFAPGIEVPLRPFFGIMAVAPPQDGHVSTAPPNDFGGNMDCKELGEGATLYLPVFKQGALFVYGDAHAGQGDGEVDLTAIEVAMDKAVFQFTVRKDMKLTKPFAETATHYIAFGFDPDLNVAAQKALREAIAFLVKQKGLSPADAYVLSSIALDMHVTQTVDGNKGVHVMIPKSIFKK